MLAAQLTRCFIQPDDLPDVVAILRSHKVHGTGAGGESAAARVARDVMAYWSTPPIANAMLYPRPYAVPALLDTVHVADVDGPGGEAMFVSLNPAPNAAGAANPVMFLGTGSYCSSNGICIASGMRRNAAAETKIAPEQVIVRAAVNAPLSLVTREHLIGPHPGVWRGRRDVFAYNDTTSPGDPLWRTIPVPAGQDLSFDAASASLLVATVEVPPV